MHIFCLANGTIARNLAVPLVESEKFQWPLQLAPGVGNNCRDVQYINTTECALKLLLRVVHSTLSVSVNERERER